MTEMTDSDGLGDDRFQSVSSVRIGFCTSQTKCPGFNFSDIGGLDLRTSHCLTDQLFCVSKSVSPYEYLPAGQGDFIGEKQKTTSYCNFLHLLPGNCLPVISPNIV